MPDGMCAQQYCVHSVYTARLSWELKEADRRAHRGLSAAGVSDGVESDASIAVGVGAHRVHGRGTGAARGTELGGEE